MGQLTIEVYKEQLERKYGEHRREEFGREWPTVQQYFAVVTETLSANYELDKVLAVGGTGIVHTGHHNRFDRPVVIKINRPNLGVAETSMVANEASVLPSLNHPNIITALDINTVDVATGLPRLTYIVEPFIAGSRPLFKFKPDEVEDTWLYNRLTLLKHELPALATPRRLAETGKADGLITSFLADLTSIFAQWVGAIEHIHEPHAPRWPQGLLYLDVKPENALVDSHGHLTVIDYGSVENVDFDDHTPLDVFFTERYAHPELVKRIKDKASSNRVRGGVGRADLSRTFDYYALGISMLEILNEVARVRPHVVPQLPLYRSLHFLATRLLAGQNSSRSSDDHYTYASQVFPGLSEADYGTLGYADLAEALRDLDKERGRWNVAEIIPELATYSKDIVRLVPGFNTVLTPRLRGVIEHPLVARLKHVTQLGLVALVYPTADHSRYDHALGSYTYTTYYVRSLFNDLGNPLFRNLVGKQDINAVLLAALLHDLGQYPLAHDLEEVHERIFKHGAIGLELLIDDTKRDRANRTLLEIITNETNGWGVSLETLRRIFRAQSKNIPPPDKTGSGGSSARSMAQTADHEGAAETSEVPSVSQVTNGGSAPVLPLKIDVLASIVDGPIDADKADYIIRDSSRCELPYGAQLDIERLLRVLTVAVVPGDGDRKVTLGVYDKGLASAHAFGQARYQLFATVYWHHTARVAKTMLQYAAAIGLPLHVFGPHTPERDDEENRLREQLIDFIKQLVPPFDPSSLERNERQRPVPMSLDLAAEPPINVIDSLDMERPTSADIDADPDGWYPGIAWTDWLMLKWLADLPQANAQSRNLLAGIQNRQLYKRVATFSRDGAQGLTTTKLGGLSWRDKIDLSRRLSKAVYKRVKRVWAEIDTLSAMTKTEFDQLYESNLLVLVDIPNPSAKLGYGRPLGVVPELREKSYQQERRHAYEDKAWQEITGRMMEGIAPVRVICHAKVRSLVSGAYAAKRADERIKDIAGEVEAAME